MFAFLNEPFKCFTEICVVFCAMLGTANTMRRCLTLWT